MPPPPAGVVAVCTAVGLETTDHRAMVASAYSLRKHRGNRNAAASWLVDIGVEGALAKFSRHRRRAAAAAAAEPCDSSDDDEEDEELGLVDSVREYFAQVRADGGEQLALSLAIGGGSMAALAVGGGGLIPHLVWHRTGDQSVGIFQHCLSTDKCMAYDAQEWARFSSAKWSAVVFARGCTVAALIAVLIAVLCALIAVLLPTPTTRQQHQQLCDEECSERRLESVGGAAAVAAITAAAPPRAAAALRASCARAVLLVLAIACDTVHLLATGALLITVQTLRIGLEDFCQSDRDDVDCTFQYGLSFYLLLVAAALSPLFLGLVVFTALAPLVQRRRDAAAAEASGAEGWVGSPASYPS